MIEIRVQTDDFDVGAELARLRDGRTDVGALVSFTGLMRELGGAGLLSAMTLEHYPGMVERELADLCSEAARRWPLLGGIVIHRHGRLTPGEQIVLVAIASAHRQAAFDAAMYVMDWLKTRAPFWKLEENAAGGRRWVDAREADDAAVARWSV